MHVTKIQPVKISTDSKGTGAALCPWCSGVVVILLAAMVFFLCPECGKELRFDLRNRMLVAVESE